MDSDILDKLEREDDGLPEPELRLRFYGPRKVRGKMSFEARAKMSASAKVRWHRARLPKWKAELRGHKLARKALGKNA